MLKEIQLANVDLNLLVLFEVVLQQRNVGRAALELHLSASAVSHGLGRLRRLFADPLFLRTPKGVVPTERALALAAPIADILARVRDVVAVATPFDPATSARRFTLGTADATAVVLLPALLSQVRRNAPNIDFSVRHLLPMNALEELDARASDVAVVALDELPARFTRRLLCQEDFVVVARARHPFLRAPTLKNYCAFGHVLVSLSGDFRGFVDVALEAKGLSRRVALVVSNFMLALAALTESDLLAAVPRRLALAQGARFGVRMVESPVALRPYQLSAVLPRAALTDVGVAWLLDRITEAANAGLPRPARRRHQ